MRSFLVIFASILFFSSSLLSQVQDTSKFISLQPADFQQSFLKEHNPLLIDVREFFEFRKSRLKGAINVPSSGNLLITADTIDKDHALFFYCTSGFRSKRVAINFYEKGFRRLYSLEGGIIAWRKEQLPVDKKRLRAHGTRPITFPAAASQSSQYTSRVYQTPD
jgi:rhodanese-related sulfurtransferase